MPGVAPFVGYVGLWPADYLADGMVEVGWRLAAAHWGNGYATEAAREALRVGFEEVGLDEIVSFTVPQNVRSRRVMERIGLRRDAAGDFDHPRVDPVAYPHLVRARVLPARRATSGEARASRPLPRIEQSFYHRSSDEACRTRYCELHAHSNFSFLDGASHPEELIARAAHAGHAGAGRHRPRRPVRRGPPLEGGAPDRTDAARDGRPLPGAPDHRARAGHPARRGRAAPRASRAEAERPAARRAARAEAGRASSTPARSRATTSSCWRATSTATPRCRGSPAAATWPGRSSTRSSSGSWWRRRSTRRAATWSASPAAATARCRATCWPASATRRSTPHGAGRGTSPTATSRSSCRTTSQPDDDWLVAQLAELADEAGLPTVVTNEVHYAEPGGPSAPGRARLHPPRRHARRGARAAPAERRVPAEDAAPSWRRIGAGLPDERSRRAWADGMAQAAPPSAGRAGWTSDFERYRFPGFTVPEGETRVLISLPACARRAYGAVIGRLPSRRVKQLAHELDDHRAHQPGRVLPDRVGPDGVRAEARRSSARGGGAPATRSWPTAWASPRSTRSSTSSSSSASSTRRATLPDIDIDFDVNRREEVIQYLYDRYGADHAAMVCTDHHLPRPQRRARGGQGARLSAEGVDGWPRRSTPATPATWPRDLALDGSFGWLFDELGMRHGRRRRSRRAATDAADAAASSTTSSDLVRCGTCTGRRPIHRSRRAGRQSRLGAAAPAAGARPVGDIGQARGLGAEALRAGRAERGPAAELAAAELARRAGDRHARTERAPPPSVLLVGAIDPESGDAGWRLRDVADAGRCRRSHRGGVSRHRAPVRRRGRRPHAPRRATGGSGSSRCAPRSTASRATWGSTSAACSSPARR